MQTFWRSLVIVGLVIASAAAGTAWAQRKIGAPGTRATEAIYFRDAYGRCLRLQPELGDDGRLVVLVMSNEACAKRERTRVP